MSDAAKGRTPEEVMEELQQEVAKTGGDIVKALHGIERRRADALVRDAIQRSQAGETDWDALVHGLGRNDEPVLLFMVWNTLPHDQRIKAIGEAWTAAEHPERALRRAEWLQWHLARALNDPILPR